MASIIFKLWEYETKAGARLNVVVFISALRFKAARYRTKTHLKSDKIIHFLSCIFICIFICGLGDHKVPPWPLARHHPPPPRLVTSPLPGARLSPPRTPPFLNGDCYNPRHSLPVGTCRERWSGGTALLPPRKQDSLAHRWLNVIPASKTLGWHWSSIGSMTPVCDFMTSEGVSKYR